MLCPTFGVMASSYDVQSDSNQLPQNITKIENGIAYTYWPNGSLISSIPVHTEEENEQINEKDIQDYQSMIPK